MTAFKNSILTFLLLISLFTLPAFSADWLNCPALQKDSSYEKRESLKYLTPGKKSWLFISSKDFKTNYSINDETLELLQILQKNLKKKKTELVLVIIPPRGLIHADKTIQKENFDVKNAQNNFKNMLNRLNKNGIPTTELKNLSSIQEYGYQRDHHWNKSGAQWVTKETAKTIKNLPIFSTIRKEEFILKDGKTVNFKGSFYNPIKDICGTELPAHKIKEQVSTSIESSLFEERKSEIVLVGTSFSEPGKSQANFAGQLRHHLSADIDNRALGGGGISTSLLNYLKSEDFQNNPAKILVWEIPGFYSLNRPKFLQEAINLTEQNQ